VANTAQRRFVTVPSQSPVGAPRAGGAGTETRVRAHVLTSLGNFRMPTSSRLFLRLKVTAVSIWFIKDVTR